LRKLKRKQKRRGNVRQSAKAAQAGTTKRQFADTIHVSRGRPRAQIGASSAAGPAIVETDNDKGVTGGRIEGGEFAVTPDGAGTYTLPLWTPPGGLGIQPQLSLRYHSRGGNGLLGVGWSLNGIPQITRDKKTVADDGAIGPVSFDQSDPFYLDGERLVLVSGTHGLDGAQYRTKLDTFTKIILHDVDFESNGRMLGPTWFEAFYKDGRIFTFGGIGSGDLGSRFEGISTRYQPILGGWLPGSLVPNDPDQDHHERLRAALNALVPLEQTVRYAWSLSSIRDRAGNTLLIYYDGDPAGKSGFPTSRDYLPMKILYTGSPVDGTPALRTVDFVWEDRPDLETRFMTGLRLVQRKRLKEVRMSAPDPVEPAELRRYVMTYRNDSVSSRSLLSTVEERDHSGIRKGSHSFNWDLGQLSFHEIDTGISNITTTPPGRSALAGRIRVADFNGDGRDDILYVPITDPENVFRKYDACLKGQNRGT